MKRGFFLFRDGRRLRAARVALPPGDPPLLAGGRRYTPLNGLAHWSHITVPPGRLAGFVFHGLEDACGSPFWRAWWDAFDNRLLDEPDEGYVFLTDSIPNDWRTDSALLVGPGIYADGEGDFALLVPDLNGHAFRPGEPTEFWKEIGFELATLDVTITS